MKRRAALERKSVSRLIAEPVEAEVHSGWPEGYEQLLGSASDFPDIVGLDAFLPPDSPRNFERLWERIDAKARAQCL